ncbi:hypothetical protein HH308_28645 [Gordonia sp. TBRC 11910]|uniref:Secreted protein n=1 Tax=Gordonia asplenii TaxID=2725283 RepID=A0A848L8V3_9ACTN|nr:hypothetical protein [Gordonia asplenii]NMO05193.1 hypothetical protein [Gordonia asplenii]
MRKRSTLLTLATASVAASAALTVAAPASAASPTSTICRTSGNTANVVARQGLAGHSTLDVAQSFPRALIPRTGGRFDVRVEWHNITTGKKGYSLRSLPVAGTAPTASFIDLPVGAGTTTYRIQAAEWSLATFSGMCTGRFAAR